MADLSNFSEENLLRWLFNDTPIAARTEWHVALYTTATDDAGGGTEATGGSYARVNYAGGWTVQDAGGGNWQAVNDAEILFPVATADWSAGANMTHTRIFDAAAGNPLVHGALATPQAVLSGNTVRYAAGQFVFSLD